MVEEKGRRNLQLWHIQPAQARLFALLSQEVGVWTLRAVESHITICQVGPKSLSRLELVASDQHSTCLLEPWRRPDLVQKPPR